MNHSLIDENRKNKISLLAFYNQSNKTFKYHENGSKTFFGVLGYFKKIEKS